MSFSFQRPVGSIADIAELEYVSALHQTDVQGGIRQDGSIQGENKEFPAFDASMQSWRQTTCSLAFLVWILGMFKLTFNSFYFPLVRYWYKLVSILKIR